MQSNLVGNSAPSGAMSFFGLDSVLEASNPSTGKVDMSDSIPFEATATEDSLTITMGREDAIALLAIFGKLANPLWRMVDNGNAYDTLANAMENGNMIHNAYDATSVAFGHYWRIAAQIFVNGDNPYRTPKPENVTLDSLKKGEIS